jgi:alpha-beta hydrolase superfamily lysophospholipase
VSTRSAQRELKPQPHLESAIRPAANHHRPFKAALRTASPFDRPVTGVLLLAHGGKERSHRPVGPRNGPVQRMRWIGTAIAPRLAGPGIAVHVLRFRYQGWNGSAKDPVADVRWAVEQLAARYGEVPVALVGHSLGGRAVVNAADAPGVVAVLGLAPWLPPTEPIAQLAGRRLLLAHGTQDRITSPRSSFEYAARARAAGHEVARVVLPSSGHTLLTRARDWNRLVIAFAHSALLSEPPSASSPSSENGTMVPRYAALISDAFAAEGARGLQRILASDGRVRE